MYIDKQGGGKWSKVANMITLKDPLKIFLRHQKASYLQPWINSFLSRSVDPQKGGRNKCFTVNIYTALIVKEG